MSKEAVLKSVEAMSKDAYAPTAPLQEFLIEYAEDDNWWWWISSGHHQNLFDEAIERIEQAVKLHQPHCTTCGVDNCRTRRALLGGGSE